MALSNFGTIVLEILVFITTLVNFTFTLTSFGPLVLMLLYAALRMVATAPEEGIFKKSQLRHLYHDG
ncbi:hypothetical protein MFRU_015g01670 [Monilinia fructicola]|nr:hypothetical protein MFRU_015g01670 [Monilinia fructicola]